MPPESGSSHSVERASGVRCLFIIDRPELSGYAPHTIAAPDALGYLGPIDLPEAASP
ncbi:hypothetical protein [Micromonospora globbae]|uniref:hypothetical protein n=1 Tax=Micromonospora globbae TaxID=1894969 RepID=UPI00342DDAA4